MRFRKTVLAEAFNLFEDALGELEVVAPGEHAVDEFALEVLEAAVALPGGHGAPQLIGFPGAEAGRDHGQFYDLFLKDRHPQRAFQDLAYPVARVGDLLQPLAAAQIRMHHVALNGPRSDDGYLDDEIVEMPGLQTRQHGHLGTRFHLKHTHTVAFP